MNCTQMIDIIGHIAIVWNVYTLAECNKHLIGLRKYANNLFRHIRCFYFASFTAPADWCDSGPSR